MTKILDWRRAEDPRDVIHLAVQALAEGHLVAFPTDQQYLVAASALRSDACGRLQRLNGSSAGSSGGVAASLVVRSADELLDFVPDAPSIAIRMAQRGWPGPLEIQLKGGHPTALTSQLNEMASGFISRQDGYLAFMKPHHESIDHVVRLSVGPLMVVPAVSQNSKMKGHALAVSPEDIASEVAFTVDDGRSVSASSPTVVRIDGSKCELLREGALSFQNMVELTQFTILFVCTGNTCRSPMAETILRSKLKEKYGDKFRDGVVPPIVTMSAGVAASPGSPASEGALMAMEKMGLDLSQHASQPASQSLLDRADWILTMTNGHRQAILSRWPHLAGKVSSLDPDGRDVSDPYGASVDVYQACASKISSYLDTWIDRLDENSMPVWDNFKEN